MAELNLDSLGDQQLSVMNVLWDAGAATVHEVREKLKHRKLAYTTILSTMQKLEKSGWLTHETRGRTYVYRPTCSRSKARASSLMAMITRLFRGDPLLMMENLLDETALDESDLTQLRKMIDQRRKELRDE